MKLKRLHPNATFKKAHKTDTGWDLTGCSFKYAGNGLWLIGLGLSGQPPTNQYIEIVPRSSFAKLPFIMPNNVGIIDSSYRGEWMFPVRHLDILHCYDDQKQILINGFNYNTETLKSFVREMIKKHLINKRIAQAIMRHRVQVFPEWVDELDETERGDGGFGSSDPEEEK